MGQDTRGRPVDFCGPKWQERDFEFSLGYYYLCPLISGWWGRGRSRQSREIGHVEIYDFSAGPVPVPRLQKEATPE